jgi:hypothetical protein
MNEHINFLANFELRGDRQVERGISNITSQLLSAKSAADVAGVALEKFGRIFEVGLGAALGTSIAGIGIAQITEAGKAFEDLADSVTDLTSKPIGNMDLSALDKDLDALQDKIKESGKDSAHGWGEEFMDGLKSLIYKMDNPIYKFFGMDITAQSPEGQQIDKMRDRLIKVRNEVNEIDQRNAAKVKERSKEDSDFLYQKALNMRPTGTSHIKELNLELDRNHQLSKRALDDMRDLQDPKITKYKSATERETKLAEAQQKLDMLFIERQQIQNELNKPKEFIGTSIRRIGGAAGNRTGMGHKSIFSHWGLDGVGGDGNGSVLGLSGSAHSLMSSKKSIDSFFNANTNAVERNTSTVQQNTAALTAVMSPSGGKNTTHLF